MRRIGFLLVIAYALAAPVRAADKPPAMQPKPVARIDSLIAMEANGIVSIKAKGAVASGGWRGAMLKSVKASDPHAIVVEFLATPPPPTEAVIMVLLPVTAGATIRMRKGVVSVRAISASNEITTQILK
jgi:hypothetical protein